MHTDLSVCAGRNFTNIPNFFGRSRKTGGLLGSRPGSRNQIRYTPTQNLFSMLYVPENICKRRSVSCFDNFAAFGDTAFNKKANSLRQ